MMLIDNIKYACSESFYKDQIYKLVGRLVLDDELSDLFLCDPEQILETEGILLSSKDVNFVKTVIKMHFSLPSEKCEMINHVKNSAYNLIRS